MNSSFFATPLQWVFVPNKGIPLWTAASDSIPAADFSGVTRMRYTPDMDKYSVLIDEAIESLRASGLISRAAVIASKDRSLFDVHLLASDEEAFLEVDTDGREAFRSLSTELERENGRSEHPGLAIKTSVYLPDQVSVFDAITSLTE